MPCKVFEPDVDTATPEHMTAHNKKTCTPCKFSRLFNTTIRGTITQMIDPTPYDDVLRRLFPTLTDDEINQVRDFFDRYTKVLLAIYERIQQEHNPDFDRWSESPYDESKGRFPLN